MSSLADRVDLTFLEDHAKHFVASFPSTVLVLDDSGCNQYRLVLEVDYGSSGSRVNTHETLEDCRDSVDFAFGMESCRMVD